LLLPAPARPPARHGGARSLLLRAPAGLQLARRRAAARARAGVAPRLERRARLLLLHRPRARAALPSPLRARRPHPARRGRRPARGAAARRGAAGARRDRTLRARRRRDPQPPLRAGAAPRRRAPARAPPGHRARPGRGQPHAPARRPRGARGVAGTRPPRAPLRLRRGPGARRALCRGRRLRRALGVRGVRPARARGGDARRAARGGRAAVARRDLPGCGARRGPARREPDRPRRRPRADGAGDAGGPRRGRRRARAPPLLGDHRPAHAGRARARGRPMSEEPRVDVVVVSYETRETLLECLAALVAEPTASVVVIDNASRDGTAAAVRERFPSVRLVANAENVGFARACNQGARESRAPYLLFLNPD